MDFVVYCHVSVVKRESGKMLMAGTWYIYGFMRGKRKLVFLFIFFLFFHSMANRMEVRLKFCFPLGSVSCRGLKRFLFFFFLSWCCYTGWCISIITWEMWVNGAPGRWPGRFIWWLNESSYRSASSQMVLVWGHLWRPGRTIWHDQNHNRRIATAQQCGIVTEPLALDC